MNTSWIWDNLVTYSFQIGLVVGLAGFIPPLLRLRWPGAKLIFWQILLAACLLLPLVRPWRQEVIAAVGVPVSATTAIVPPAGPVARSPMPRSEMALLLLAVGALIRLFWLGVGFWRLRRHRLLARLLSVRSGCPTFLSDEIASPVTFGWRKPVVLLPAHFPELDRPIQEAILCHELLHVERRDWLFTVSEEVVRAIFWFHPAIWWLLGEIQLAREQAVDSLAIERTAARDEYVDALLAIAGVTARPDLALAPLFLRKRHLKQRVMSIFKEVRMSKTRFITRLAMGLAVLAAACWIVTGTFPLAAAPQFVNDAPGVTVDAGGPLLHRAPVSYPESARKQGVQGTVIVEATLDGTGNVTDAHVLSGPDGLRKAAMQSVLQWHFTGAAAGTTRTVSIAFQLPEPQSLAPPQKQISPELQAKLTETRANPPNVEQYVGALRSLSSTPNPPGTQKVKSITVIGLSDPMRDELLSKLPFHEGDTLPNGWNIAFGATVLAFDEHLIISVRSSSLQWDGTRLATGEADITISAPNSPSSRTTVNERQAGTSGGAKIVRMVHPSYPPEAKAARISGVVKLNAVIAADGTIKNLEVISGHPLLVPAALEAVKQWVYQPTLLNGNPVEVKTEISVNFTLSE